MTRHALLIEVESDFVASRRHFFKAKEIFDRGPSEYPDEYDWQAAMLHAAQSGHTALESALKRILQLFNEPLPGGDNSHRDLIRRSAMAVGDRPALLDRDEARLADETRGFRHVAIHVYEDGRLDVNKARIAVDAGCALAEAIPGIFQRLEARLLGIDDPSHDQPDI